jgi:hypothetical protein
MAASAALNSSGATPFGVLAFGVFCGVVEKVLAGDESSLFCEKACLAIPQTERRVAAQKTLKISERNKEIPNRKIRLRLSQFNALKWLSICFQTCVTTCSRTGNKRQFRRKDLFGY